MLGGASADKRLADSAKREHQNSSCRNLDHLISTSKESGDQLGEQLKRKLNETADEPNKPKSRNRSQFNSFRLKAFIGKRQSAKNSIKRKSISAPQSVFQMTNESRTVHLHVIEREFRKQLKDDQLQGEAKQREGDKPAASRTVSQTTKHKAPDDSKRRQSTGEILKHPLAHRALDSRPTNQSELTKSLNENLFQSHPTLTGECVVQNSCWIRTQCSSPNSKAAQIHFSTVPGLQSCTSTQLPGSTSVELTIEPNEDESIRSRLSRTDSSKTLSSKCSASSKLTASSKYSKSSSKSSSSSVSPFRLPFGLFSSKADSERRISFGSLDGSTKGILKGVQSKLASNLITNRVAQVRYFSFNSFN